MGDGGVSGGAGERPALTRLRAEELGGHRRGGGLQGRPPDPRPRGLAKIVELFDTHGVSFVSVSQEFNTTASMGRLTLNELPSCDPFEREATGERITDTLAASKAKGMDGRPAAPGYAHDPARPPRFGAGLKGRRAQSRRLPAF